MPIIPTATFLAEVVELAEGRRRAGAARHHPHEAALRPALRAHARTQLGIKLLIGTDTGNNSFTRYGELHAKELEIFVKYGGYTPARRSSRRPATTPRCGRPEGQVGELAPGRLADLIVLDKDPIADITVLQGGKQLSWVIKDGRIVDLDPRDEMLTFQQAAE